MRDISNITGQALSSGAKLLWSTIAALLIASLLLLIAVLPAEYGLDPTGLGQKMKLITLHQPEEQPQQQLEKQGIGEVVQKRSEKWRSDMLQLTIQAKQGIEVKTLINQGERLLFQWTTSGGKVNVDMHGNTVGAAEDDFTSYWLGKEQTEAAGTFEAPFTGLHGWYWENKSNQAVKITLSLEGYYQDLVQH